MSEGLEAGLARRPLSDSRDLVPEATASTSTVQAKAADEGRPLSESAQGVSMPEQKQIPASADGESRTQAQQKEAALQILPRSSSATAPAQAQPPERLQSDSGPSAVPSCSVGGAQTANSPQAGADEQQPEAPPDEGLTAGKSPAEAISSGAGQSRTPFAAAAGTAQASPGECTKSLMQILYHKITTKYHKITIPISDFAMPHLELHPHLFSKE